MICDKCGKEIEDGSVFCEFCGGKCEVPKNANSFPGKKIIGVIATSVFLTVTIVVGLFFFYNGYMKPMSIYKQGVSYLDTGYYEKAKEIFAGISSFKDSKELISECDYRNAVDLMDVGQFDDAKTLFIAISDYHNSQDMAYECDYQKALVLFNAGNFYDAKEIWRQIAGYNDSADMVKECIYQNIMAQYGKKNLWEVANVEYYFNTLESLGNYKDCDERILADKYDCAVHLMSDGKYENAITWFSDIIEYEDSKECIELCYTALIQDCVNKEKYADALSYCNSMKNVEIGNYDEQYNYVCAAAYSKAEEYATAKEWDNAKTHYQFLKDLEYGDASDKYDEVVKLEEEAKKKAEEKKKADEKAAAEKAAADKAAKAAAQVPYDNITGTWSRGDNVLKISNRKWGYYVSEKNYQDFKWAGLDDSLTYKDGVYYLYNSFWGKTYTATISGDELTVTLYSNDDPSRAEMGYAGKYIKTSSSIN